MKRLPKLILAVFFCTALTLASASERWETLRAINMVENPTNQTGYGSKGELGPYQFRSSTWRMYTRKSFQLANDRASSDEVAVQHYEWIKTRLSAAGIDPNRYNIAMSWNCGVTAVINGKIPMQTYYYAERVNNLAENFRSAETPVQIVVTEQSETPEGVVSFKVVDRDSTPEFKIVDDPFRFSIAGVTPRYVVAATQPQFVVAFN